MAVRIFWTYGEAEWAGEEPEGYENTYDSVDEFKALHAGEDIIILDIKEV